MTPDRATVEQFVAALFVHADPDTYIAMRAFDDLKDGEPALFTEGVQVGSPQLLDRACARIADAASSTRPVVFCPPIATFKAREGAKGSDLANGVALSVECDSTPKEALATLSNLLGHPTVVVASGGIWHNPKTGKDEDKLHLHWRIKEPTRDAAGHADLYEARGLACALVGADATTVAIVHPIRWPGSWHRKKTPRLARIVAETKNELDLDDALAKLREVVPAAPKRPNGSAKASPFGFAKDLTADVLDVTSALAVIPNDGADWHQWNKIGMATWAATEGKGFPAFDAWSQKSPKYDPTATLARWEHFPTSPPNEIGAGSLFFYAREAFPGWEKPSQIQERLKSANGNQGPDFGPAQPGTGKPKQEDQRPLSYQGMLVSAERDRLKIAQDLAPSPEFPIAELPPLLREAVAALEEHVQAPRALCCHSVLSAATLCAQGLANVDVASLPVPKPSSLFFLVIAVSGERKSACDDIALHAVGQIEKERHDDYLEELKLYKAAKASSDAERKKIETNKEMTQQERQDKLLKVSEPEEPLVPYLRAKEPNLEGLLNFAKDSRGSIGVFTSEGGQFLGGHGMTDDARVRTITGMSELWDSGSAQRMRAKERTKIDGVRVSVSLAAQPRIASKLLSDEMARDQGFVGRFLMTMPDSTIGTREIRPSRPLDDRRLMEFHRRCRVLLGAEPTYRAGTRNELELPAIGLDEEAWQVWRGVAQSIEDQCGPEGMWTPIRSAALKMAENIARIACVLTVFQDPDAVWPARRATAITGRTMATAASIGGFYLQEALRLIGHDVIDPETRALEELAEWMTSKWEHECISPSHIQRLAPNHLRGNAEIVRGRIAKLCEAGVLSLAGRSTIDGKAYREAFRVVREEGLAA